MKEKNIKIDTKIPTLFQFEQQNWDALKTVCGIDEVGRGCLAGPVITAAVILQPYVYHDLIKDSKLLTPLQIEKATHWIMQHSTYSIGINHNRLIDKKNIINATKLSMKKALFQTMSISKSLPDIIAIDAVNLNLENSIYEKIPMISWIKGESKSASIACASIIAKYFRDKIMKSLDRSFPLYQFKNHKGYGTSAHINTLKLYNACILHRTTFIKNFKEQNDESSQQQTLL